MWLLLLQRYRIYQLQQILVDSQSTEGKQTNKQTNKQTKKQTNSINSDKELEITTMNGKLTNK